MYALHQPPFDLESESVSNTPKKIHDVLETFSLSRLGSENVCFTKSIHFRWRGSIAKMFPLHFLGKCVLETFSWLGLDSENVSIAVYWKHFRDRGLLAKMYAMHVYWKHFRCRASTAKMFALHRTLILVTRVKHTFSLTSLDSENVSNTPYRSTPTWFAWWKYNHEYNAKQLPRFNDVMCLTSE